MRKLFVNLVTLFYIQVHTSSCIQMYANDFFCNVSDANICIT